jgi:hypothetical protein
MTGRKPTGGPGDSKFGVASALDAIGQSVLALVKPGGTGCQATLDGSTGRVIFGKAKLVEPDPASGEFATFMKWAGEFRKLGV